MEQISAEQAGKAKVVKVNIDDEPQLAQREQIEVIPTFVLYKDGKAVSSIVAPESRAAIEEFLREGLK